MHAAVNVLLPLVNFFKLNNENQAGILNDRQPWLNKPVTTASYVKASTYMHTEIHM